MKYEAKKMMSIIFLETLNIELGQIDPKGNRRVKKTKHKLTNSPFSSSLILEHFYKFLVVNLL